ncbi:hypothetical protein [Latilactobacillus graminis]|uniref:MacB-like core domain-containing protein n=2 Tax=Latilactobacillus graminis TaxID=60519 RepID=A0AA89I090_9LACO|nr:hypothetical protein [Latilactobacillus graminis]KRM22246.1 hypothetical protein FC90_GL000845 [Latilactobacillus graminis DSM 20719]QFP79578.1 hypothetical protein LG542_04720 [Latilactobacillus graminis]
MRLKKFLLDCLLVGVTVLGMLMISQRAKANYSQRLNHNSLSENAVIFNSHSRQSLQKTIQRIDVAQLNHFQIQFNVNSRFSYIYAKGKLSSVPLKDGRFFSSYDFKSQIPVVVAGQSRLDELYKPASQTYYQDHGRYLSVIGVVGTNQATSLDQHIFVSTSPKFVLNNRPLNKVTILVDDPQINAHLKIYQKIFKTAQHHFLTPKTTPLIGVNWVTQNAWVIIVIILLILGAVYLTYLFSQVVNGYHTQKGLGVGLYRKFRTAQTQIFSLHLVVSSMIGFAIGSWFFYLIGRTAIFCGIVGVDVVLISLFYYLLPKNRRAARTLKKI